MKHQTLTRIIVFLIYDNSYSPPAPSTGLKPITMHNHSWVTMVKDVICAKLMTTLNYHSIQLDFNSKYSLSNGFLLIANQTKTSE